METGKVIEAAIAYFENDIRRISHLPVSYTHLDVYKRQGIYDKERISDMITIEKNLYALHTRHTSYVFCVMESGHPEHLFYGCLLYTSILYI